MTALSALLDTFRAAGKTERERGTYFEELIVGYLRTEPLYKELYATVEPYSAGAARKEMDRRDTGIDLAAAEAKGPSYSEFLRRLLREEYHAQQVRFLDNRIARAQLPERWTLETFPWERQPGVQRAVIEQLASLDFIARGTNLVFMGPPAPERPASPAPSCCAPCWRAAQGSSSRPRSSSTSCTARWRTTRRGNCLTA